MCSITNGLEIRPGIFFVRINTNFCTASLRHQPVLPAILPYPHPPWVVWCVEALFVKSYMKDEPFTYRQFRHIAFRQLVFGTPARIQTNGQAMPSEQTVECSVKLCRIITSLGSTFADCTKIHSLFSTTLTIHSSLLFAIFKRGIQTLNISVKNHRKRNACWLKNMTVSSFTLRYSTPM